uniref:Aminotransferase-like plant mobile domain-containing protein n=1 Tax=Fagus sylvatica TaxID=28930 RepID=A0A2N9IFH2_FAGSY
MASIDVNTPAGNIEVAPRIRHHCIVSKLMDVNKSLSEECKSQLQTTPFGWLLNLHCNIEASGRMLEVMATSWNADARAFQVGDRLIPFTLYDIALILGLPVRGEPIDCNQSHSGGSVVEKLLNRHLKTTSPERTQLVTLLTKPSIQVPNRAVYDFLVSGLSRAASSMQAKKGRGNLHIQGCTALLQVLSVLVAMPWEQEFNVVEEAMETLQETHGSSHPTISRDDGAGPSNRTQTPSNQLQLELQAERAEREALARQVGRLKDELDHVKGLVATVLESSPNIQQNQTPPSQNQPPPSQNQPPPSQSQLPIQTPIVDLPSSPSKAVKRGKAAKKKAKVAMVDLASSPSKRDNAGEAAAAVVDLVSSPSKGATSVRPNEVDSNEVAISTETYELTGREVSSLLGDQAQGRWF